MINNSLLLEKYDETRKPHCANKKGQLIFPFNKSHMNNTSVIYLLGERESKLKSKLNTGQYQRIV